MSDQTAGGGRFWVGLLAVVVVSIVLISGTGGDGTPYDPRSVQPNGAKAAVEVLEDLGAQVSLGNAVPAADATAALLLRDRLSVGDRNALLQWVGDGGALVVADPFSPLVTSELRLLAQDSEVELETGTCTITPLRSAERVVVEFAVEARVDSQGRSCFGDGGWAYIVETSAGDGTIVFIGGQELFTNERLDDDDAAAVVVNLLAPSPQSARVAVIAPSVLATDEPRTVSELLNVRVLNALLMAGAAFLLYATYRGRRLGRVVEEPLPVPIRGSELVLRHGHLEHRSNDPGGSAAVLRAAAVRRLGSALRIADETSLRDVDASVRHREFARRLASHVEVAGRFTAEELDRAFVASVTTDDHLVTVAQQLSRIESTILDPAAETNEAAERESTADKTDQRPEGVQTLERQP